jgi:hypothetical protein
VKEVAGNVRVSTVTVAVPTLTVGIEAKVVFVVI